MSRCQTRIAKQTKNLVSGITLNFHLRNTMLTRTESTGDWPAHVQARTILTSVLFLHSSRHILSSTIPGQSLEGIPTEQLNSRTSFASTLPTIFFQTLHSAPHLGLCAVRIIQFKGKSQSVSAIIRDCHYLILLLLHCLSHQLCNSEVQNRHVLLNNYHILCYYLKILLKVVRV